MTTLRRSTIVRLFVIATLRVYQQGLGDLFAADSRFEVTGTARNAREGLLRMQVARPAPNVALIEVGPAEGMDGARLIHPPLPAVRLIALGLADDPEEIIDWVEAGIGGYVSSEASIDELVQIVA